MVRSRDYTLTRPMMSAKRSTNSDVRIRSQRINAILIMSNLLEVNRLLYRVQTCMAPVLGLTLERDAGSVSLISDRACTGGELAPLFDSESQLMQCLLIGN
jgi:hypothetical protein